MKAVVCECEYSRKHLARKVAEQAGTLDCSLILAVAKCLLFYETSGSGDYFRRSARKVASYSGREGNKNYKKNSAKAVPAAVHLAWTIGPFVAGQCVLNETLTPDNG